ncbi:MAG: ABC transporter ATP-binding protein [Sulfurihydrogenibium sp.]|jgi:putative ABC transport system ATP-binding protein/lipoprotein-releasing system ATP-binding protein|uniref:ABC transporter ATP-binding protein n=1 Tax=Sulfurihydrogenibium sp. TaxID=2053621 RepID=UPI000CB898D7|nr:MAG: lipoprotein-releasing system ATP-binding protein LolD [Sulfurihydrogenibium sp.]
MSNVILQNVKKVYKNGQEEVVALKGISLEIEKGSMVALMGPSGSGKSTLLHIIGGVDFPTEGKVLIDGQEINKFDDKTLSKFRNQNVGFVFQFHYLLPEFTALENVMLPIQIKGEKNPEKKAEEILTKLNLLHRKNHKPAQLSGGEQQRVAIARAIANNPSLLIADEPTGNLDSQNAKNVIILLKELNEKNKMTIIIATHDVEIAKYCQYIYFIRDGMLVNVEKV